MFTDLNYINFYSFLKNDLVLVEFWAEWCHACQSFDPLMQDISKKFKGKLKMAKVNISDNRTIADQQKVKNIPSIILYLKGKEMIRFSDIPSKQTMINTIEKHLTI